MNDPARADAIVTLARSVVGGKVDISARTAIIDWDRFTVAVVSTLHDQGDWTEELTHLGDLLKSENPEWPGDAIFFIIYTWLRIGMHHLIQGFNLIHDDKPFDGKFKVADLLDAMGIHVSLNDRLLATIKSVFSHAGHCQSHAMQCVASKAGARKLVPFG